MVMHYEPCAPARARPLAARSSVAGGTCWVWIRYRHKLRDEIGSTKVTKEDGSDVNADIAEQTVFRLIPHTLRQSSAMMNSLRRIGP